MDEDDALRARIASLEEALMPSAETKAAYSGEVKVRRITGVNVMRNEVFEMIDVPWTAIKQIMAMIRARAELNKGAS